MPPIFVAGPSSPDGGYDLERSVTFIGPSDTVAALHRAFAEIRQARQDRLTPPPEALPGTHAMVGFRLDTALYLLDEDISGQRRSGSRPDRRQLALQDSLHHQSRILSQAAARHPDTTDAAGMWQIIEDDYVAPVRMALTDNVAKGIVNGPIPNSSLQQTIDAGEALQERLIDEASRQQDVPTV